MTEHVPGEYIDCSFKDINHLGYDEDGYEIPLPDNARVVTRLYIGAICPGLIETPMTKQLFGNPEFVEMINKASGRTGKPEDIAKVSLFLASDLSDYVNGVEISVDGGLINSL